MEYRYKRSQIFKRKLDIPKYVLERVYTCKLTFAEYVQYDLDGKIPSSCLVEKDRLVFERFGYERCKKLDWELIDSAHKNINVRELLLSISADEYDVNMRLYEMLKDHIKPSRYSPMMKKVYADRLYTIPKEMDGFSYLKYQFNDGELSLEQIIRNWRMFQEKDLSFCLLHDRKNRGFNITDRQVKQFMSEYKTLVPLILEHREIYKFIDDITSMVSAEEKHAYLKVFTDELLDNTVREYGDYRPAIILSDDEYREVFKYSSLEEYLMKYDEYDTPVIMRELESLPDDYIFNMPIPISVLFDRHVLNFIGTYGLKNVVDFDNECGHFFTKNDCGMLKLMFNMYLHYGGNEHDPKRRIFTKEIIIDENGNYVDRPYTKDEFYEAMRRMILYGPSDWNYADKAPDYRAMVGEFRVRNAELFIDSDAPEELQNLFYTKSITPKLLIEHPEYIPYLAGKDLSSCMKARQVQVEGSSYLYKYEYLYNFLGTKLGFSELINFITQYSDVFDILFERNYQNSIRYDVKFAMDDDIGIIEDKICEVLKLILIENNIAYPEIKPNTLLKKYPTMFLAEDAPKELKEALYSRNINSDLIFNNPIYRDYLREIDLELIFKYVRVSNSGYPYKEVNLVSVVKELCGDEAFDVMLGYEKYIYQLYASNSMSQKLDGFKYSPKLSREQLFEEMNSIVLNGILSGKLKYDDQIYSSFKERHPDLFLSDDVDKALRDKFYAREFTLRDFSENPDLIEIFSDTNIVCGLSQEYAWMIPLFDELDDKKLANCNRLKVISTYLKINDASLRTAFKDFIIEYDGNLDVEKLEFVADVLLKLSLSNSNEIYTFRKELATQILKADNPLDVLNRIEEVFIRSEIPTVGKVYSCFEILHPDFKGFDYNSLMVSPVLKKSSVLRKRAITFADLIKASFGSNNRSVNKYLEDVEKGSELYNRLRDGSATYNDLSDEEKPFLAEFTSHLGALYNNTYRAKKNNDIFVSSGNVVVDLMTLAQMFSVDGSLDYNLGDRLVRMFCGFAGFDTLKQAKTYILQKREGADRRNRGAATKPLILAQGDFVKGIGNITFLRNILQNGSVSKEYLGASADSDLTPLDTDVSIVRSDAETIADKIGATEAASYGPIWFVLKNDDRFACTRTTGGDTGVDIDKDKLEVFYTGAAGQGHYGIRTGFASCEINYIVVENFDPRIGLEIAMNGFYIPVANTNGEIIFTPDDYDTLRSKMTGLSYFSEETYSFSENLITAEVENLASQIESSNVEVCIKRDKIDAAIKSALEELGLNLKTEIDGDLTEGYVELIDTGSTGRGTNKPGDGDFDLMMRLDKSIISNPKKLGELKATLLKKLGRDNSDGVIGTGDFRLKDVSLDEETNVDIDITFTEKTDKISYSTDMALQDRLTTIKQQDPEKYNYVVANILYAKQILKDAGVYKPNRGEMPQGGLGGVGVENWILQNGGSFVDAARSFVEAARGKNFAEFKESYQIWDFGDNHLAERRGQYVHDNFVANNMSEEGYHRMVEALTGYLKKKGFVSGNNKLL